MYLLDDLPENEPLREQVRNLLASSITENLAVALQLIQGGGLHPSFILPLWANYPKLPPTQKGKANELLKKSFAGKVYPMKEEENIKFEVNNYDFDTFMRVYERLQMLYPEHCTTEKFAEFFFPLSIYKVPFFDFFYEKLPDMRVFLIKNMEEVYNTNQLHLNNSTLTCLPPEVGEFPYLRAIYINNSSINELPESFYTLQKLRYFHYNSTPLAQNKQVIKVLQERMPALSAFRFFEDATELYYEGDFKKAAKKMKKAVQLCPEEAELWNLYGEALYAMGAFVKALESFEEVLRLNPRNGYAFGKVAELKYENKLYEEAQQMCETFLQNPTLFDYEDRDESNILLTQGLVFFHFRRYDESIVAYQKSNALCNFAETWYNLACAYGKKGNKTQMLKHLREVFLQDYNKYYKICLKDEARNFEGFYKDADFKALLREFKIVC